MRRDIGYLLAGLGAFLLVMTVFLPTYIAPSVLKWPLNEYLATTLQATNASYFSPQKLTEISGVTIAANYTFVGDGAKGTSSTAVWNEFNYVHDVTNNAVIQIGTRTFAFDRKTAALVNCCGANINGNPGIRQTGIAGFAFPVGTQQKNYLVYDVTAGKAEPFVYSGTATVHGIRTYMFDENVGPTPATGEPTPSNYQNHVVYYIDPRTGIPLNITEHEIVTAQSSGATLFNANLLMTPASVDSLVGKDNSNRTKISLLETIIPLSSGILGVLLLAIGALLARRGRGEDVQPGPAAGASQPASSPASASSASTLQSEILGLKANVNPDE